MIKELRQPYSYLAMRALGDTDAFLATDLGVRKALARLGFQEDSRSAEALAESWRPWRSYAVQHLWAHLADAPTGNRECREEMVA